MEKVLKRIKKHPEARFVHVYDGPHGWHCSVYYDDARKKSLCADGATPRIAAERALAMLDGRIPRSWR